MGLSIHYSGSFNNAALLEAMIDEVKDIAEVYEWKYTIQHTCFPKNTFGKLTYDGNIYGISFTPSKSETVSLTFLSNGKMCSGTSLLFFGDTDDVEERQYLYMLSTKTQYAGSTIHKIIIHILKYISSKYLQDFKLTDEGDYWETGDETILENNFKIYNDLLDGFAEGLSKEPMDKTESFTQYFERILKIIAEKRDKNK